MLNFNDILGTTHAAIVKGADVAHAASVAFPAIAKAGPTIAALLRAERDGTTVALSVSAARLALIGGLRCLLVDNGVNCANATAVRNAIRDDVWQDEGEKQLHKDKENPLSKAELLIYERIGQRISRLAKEIVGAPKVDLQKATVRVSRDCQAEVTAALEAFEAKLAKLRGTFDGAQVSEALKRAKAAAKKSA